MRTSPFHFLSTSLFLFLLNQNSSSTTTELSPTTTTATAMSTDLQLRQDLPAIRLASLKIKLPESSSLPQLDSNSTSEESCTVQLEETEVEECRTPTAPENRIPEITVCPPAPKKQRMTSGPNCKRRISDQFQFFEIVAGDEVESFFRSSYEFINRNSDSNKRRRRCPL